MYNNRSGKIPSANLVDKFLWTHAVVKHVHVEVQTRGLLPNSTWQLLRAAIAGCTTFHRIVTNHGWSHSIYALPPVPCREDCAEAPSKCDRSFSCHLGLPNKSYNIGAGLGWQRQSVFRVIDAKRASAWFANLGISLRVRPAITSGSLTLHA